MRRMLSFEEREMLIAFVGHDSWRVKEEHVHLGTHPGPDGVQRHYTFMADDGQVELHVGEDFHSLMHEYGHGVHALKYPESIDWPMWKAEAFAMMSDMRAMKRKGLLTPAGRASFARHIRGMRRDGSPDHKLGLKLAFRAVFNHTWPKDQEKHVVSAQTPQA